jgi:microcystin-dependent protein
MSTNISLTMGTLSKSCYEDLQEHAVDLVSQMTGTVLDGSLKYIISETAPGADDRDKLWIKTSSGAPVRQYVFYNGAWVWPHHIPAADGRVIIYTGSAASVDTLDGGTAGTAYTAAGPFWQIATELSGRFPLGVGTLDSGTAVAVTDTGGEEKHTLTQDELPDHEHTLTVNEFNNFDSSNASAAQFLLGDQAVQSANSSKPNVTVDGGGSDEAHNNMPPYYGVYFIKRTARQYYVG